MRDHRPAAIVRASTTRALFSTAAARVCAGDTTIKLCVDVGSSAVKLVRQADDGDSATIRTLTPPFDRAVLGQALRDLGADQPSAGVSVTSARSAESPNVAEILGTLAAEHVARPAFTPGERALAGFARMATSQLRVDAVAIADLGAERALAGRLGAAREQAWSGLKRGLGGANADTAAGLTADRAAALLGYLRGGGGIGVDSPPGGDPLGEAFETWLEYQSAIGDLVGEEPDLVVVWTGGGGALVGASISQSMGHPWCALSTLPRFELALGALGAETIPTVATAPVGEASGAAPVGRVAWPDTGFIQVPSVELAHIGPGQAIEGPLRVLCPSGDLIVPPETYATRVGGFLVCGAQPWE